MLVMDRDAAVSVYDRLNCSLCSAGLWDAGQVGRSKNYSDAMPGVCLDCAPDGLMTRVPKGPTRRATWPSQEGAKPCGYCGMPLADRRRTYCDWRCRWSRLKARKRRRIAKRRAHTVAIGQCVTSGRI